MKFKKITALVIALALAVCFASMTVFAGADVDFTLRPDTSKTQEFAPGDTIDLYVDITTKTSNGYNNFTLEIGYNSDVLTYSSPAIDENGCTGNASNGVLTLTYNEPDGKNTPNGDIKHIKVQFTVLEGAPGGETAFSGKVTCYGSDTTGTQKLRTAASMYDKKVTISDISAGGATNKMSESDYPVLSEIPEEEESDDIYREETEERSGGVGVGWVIILILLAFGGGFILGYKICEKNGGGAVPRRRFSSAEEPVEDDDDEELPSFSKRSSARMSAAKNNEPSDDFDPSYFGHTGGVNATTNDVYERYASPSSGRFSMDDDDDLGGMPDDDGGFPGSFFPRNYTSKTRVKDDDGFGSFDDSGDNASSFSGGSSFGSGSSSYGSGSSFGSSSFGSGSGSFFNGGFESSGFDDDFGDGNDDPYRLRRR